MAISVTWERKDEVLIAMPVGRIDGSNADEFQRLLESGINPADQAFILNFERVTFISSAGLRICLVIAKKFNEPGKKFAVCTLSYPVREVVAVSGFDQIITVHDSQAAAINAVRAS